ncbi:CGNR zinc finger domain-containing protein [Streptomyces sp. NPDC006923]|uniref:CGNR zinc finger domain-containing protein n=1 Tax=Streptomyces sp. NPDC006923 TaxID=3155355 RepID=UPI0033C64DA5
MADENAALALLNSRPVVDGEPRDALGADDEGARWLRARGGSGSAGELRTVRRARDLLDSVVRGEAPAGVLAEVLEGVHRLPHFSDEGLTWKVCVEEDARFAVDAVLAWDELRREAPGRLRPCVNPECRLFLIDRSHANRARWCSMATCGNRMKARRHHERSRAAGT